MNDIKHGLYGYKYFNCRCDICTTANRQSARKYRSKHRKGLKEGSFNLKNHGDYGWSVGCRCNICSEAHKQSTLLNYRNNKEYFKTNGGFKSSKTKHGSYTAYQSYGCRCDLCRSFISNERTSKLNSQP